MTNILCKYNFPQAAKLEEKVKNSRYVIGLDLHKKTTAITVFEQTSGQPNIVFQRKRMQNNQLLQTIQKFHGLKVVVVEACYGWRLFRNAIQDIPDTTFLPLDARKTAAWAQMSGVKNDRVDSEILAYACLQGGTPRLAVFQSSTQNQEYFKLALSRDSLVKQQTRIKNQLKAIHRDYEKNPYNDHEPLKPEIIKTLENNLLDQLILLKKHLNSLEKIIKNINRADQVTSILQTIPGIGPITSFALRAKIDDLARFQDARHLSSYFGFSIRQHQSGEHFRGGKITKTGNSLIRNLLVQGAHTVQNHHPEYIPLYFPDLSQKVLDTKQKNKLVVAVARKMLTFVYYCWKNGTEFDIDAYKQMRVKQSLKNTKNQDPSLSSESTPKAADLESVTVL